ncbi:hypothetical protein [Siphonobacter sp. SORGH_AS_0500]|uniref:hypothetical protein n=1 Tax=Siphonobacter sp. SORGH_AS_0500 TaxID=1864824 RepID=UPI00285677B4|nr:hypothetical protein [Siphonobacter sp. SORGH_AS_0500]MDR6195929.1 hypothetical protein [Siphonobacter sp. SORGH_AS_0500]
MEILNEKQQLEREMEAIKARQSQIAEEERQAAETKRNEQLIIHANLNQQAQSLRAEAAQAPEEKTKLLLYGQAADITTEANRLAVELGLLKADELEEKPRFAISKKAKPFIQIGGLLTVLAWLYLRFYGLKDAIDVNNLKVEPFSQVRPYGLDSMQKLVYEKFALGVDALAAFGLLALFAPVIFSYVVPFSGSQNDLSTDFKTELTAWQRILISVSLLLGLFLLLGLSHSVKA